MPFGNGSLPTGLQRAYIKIEDPKLQVWHNSVINYSIAKQKKS